MQLKITEQENKGLFADCTLEEHERRIARLREEMDREGVDGLYLTQETNVRYASAMQDVAWVIHAYFYTVFIPRDDTLPSALFVPNGGQIQTQASWIDTVVRWDFPPGFYMGRVGDSLIESFAEWLRKLGLEKSTIATEMSAHFRLGLSVDVLDGLRDALPDVTWRDCGPVVWPVRSIKSDEEVRRLRESVRISCLGIEAGFEALREGMSERELVNVMCAKMFEEGGSEIKFTSLYAGPDRALWADSTPRREMKINPGSLIQFDGGCTYDGYYTDIKRFASLGEPTEDQRRFYNIARAAEQAAIDAVKPGVSYGEVYESSQQAIRDAGYPEFVEQAQASRWTSIGHNIGLDLHEMPGIAKDNAAVLQPNQVICIEPFFFHDGGFPIWNVPNKYGCEDQVLVTETGHEVLSSDDLVSRDIWVA